MVVSERVFRQDKQDDRYLVDKWDFKEYMKMRK